MLRAKETLVLVLLLGLVVGALLVQLVKVREAGERQDGYTSNAGELVRDVLVGQTFRASQDNLSGLAVKFATYSGRENTHEVRFHLRRSTDDGNDVRTAQVWPEELGDNQFYRFTFDPIRESAGQTFFFFVVSPDSVPGNAVTVDVDARDPYHFGSAYLVRGQGPRVTDAQVLSRSGKPQIDVSFETFYTVPLRVAAVNWLVAARGNVIQAWHDQRALFVTGVKVAAVAGLLILLLGWIAAGRYLPVRWILGGLVVMAVVVRVMYAVELPVTNDEGNYLYDARTLLEGRLAGGDAFVKAPLVVVWVALWSVFGQSMLIGRLSSIVIGALTILPIYVLGREIGGSFDGAGGKRVGLTAASVWALLGVTTVFNIYVHTQPLAIFFGVSGLAVLMMAWRGKAGVNWFLAAGMLLGLGVVSRKSVLALGLVPLALILMQGVSWRTRRRQVAVVGLGFLLVVAVLLTWAGWVYGVEGFWEALGVNSAEDGLTGVDPAEREQVRAYSIRGMTPFFRESLPLILLAMIGLGLALERLLLKVRATFYLAKLGWLVPFYVFWWAWSFWLEYEGSSAMVFGMRELWYAMAAVLLLVAALPRRGTKVSGTLSLGYLTPYLAAVLVAPLWVGGLVIFYMNWIKFHANYIGEFLPPLVLLAGIAVPGMWQTVRNLRPLAVRAVVTVSIALVLTWGLFVSGFVTLTNEHTGTFQLGAVKEAAAWAAENIPIDEPIFTGAAIVPALSGHQTALDIAHPRWYAYEFTRKDTKRLNTFLPAAPAMVQAFREAQWFLLDRQTAFSFLQEYEAIEAGLEQDFESVKGISNGSNTLTFYRRIRPAD